MKKLEWSSEQAYQLQEHIQPDRINHTYILLWKMASNETDTKNTDWLW